MVVNNQGREVSRLLNKQWKYALNISAFCEGHHNMPNTKHKHVCHTRGKYKHGGVFRTFDKVSGVSKLLNVARVHIYIYIINMYIKMN